jgi:hypothetical protein
MGWAWKGGCTRLGLPAHYNVELFAKLLVLGAEEERLGGWRIGRSSCRASSPAAASPSPPFPGRAGASLPPAPSSQVKPRALSKLKPTPLRCRSAPSVSRVAHELVDELLEWHPSLTVVQWRGDVSLIWFDGLLRWCHRSF